MHQSRTYRSESSTGYAGLIAMLRIVWFLACWSLLTTDAQAETQPRNIIHLTTTSEADHRWHRVSLRQAPKMRIEFQAPKLVINDTPAKVKRFKTRGQTCLGYRRTCFSVKLSEPVKFYDKEGSRLARAERFFLISMGGDKGYINMMMGYQFMDKVGLFPSDFTYTELWINGTSQGLYLVVEDPERMLIREKKAKYVARRSYNGRIYTKKIRKSSKVEDKEYKLAFKMLRRLHRPPSGESLYQQMHQRAHIEHYMQWLAINYLVMNGDYDDELFVYTQEGKDCGDHACDPIYFDFMAWDMDDLFRGPHSSEANYDFSEVDGEEVKTIKLVLEESVLYSLETKIDQRILKDYYLYKRYQQTARALLTEVLTEAEIKAITARTRLAIMPYLDQEHILQASRKDGRVRGGYTREFILNLIQEREAKLLKQRRAFLQDLR